MKKNYIILTHKNPEQLLNLVNKLNDSFSSFYIHLDKNVEIKPFQEILLENKDVKFIKKRENGTWGDIDIVRATINCMKEIILDNKEGHIILISGQDYPIKSQNKINTFFNNNKNYDFIDISPIEEVFPKQWKTRIYDYKYNISTKKGRYIIFPNLSSKSFFSYFTARCILKLIIFNRDINLIKKIVSNLNKKRINPTEIEPYAGGQWWALTKSTVIKTLEFINKNEAFIKYHENTLLPDEVFFHSIINHLSEKDATIKIKPSITYVNWQRKNCVLPVTFNADDINELITQPEGKLFARKFDYDYDKGIFKKLDEHNT